MKDPRNGETTSIKIGDTVVVTRGRGSWTAAIRREEIFLEMPNDQFVLYFTQLRENSTRVSPLAKHNYAFHIACSIAGISGLEGHVEENFTLTKEGHHQFKLV